MNIKSILIPIYNWDLIVISSIKENDIESIYKETRKYGVPDERTNESLNKIIGFVNNGATLSNSTGKMSFVFFSPITSEINFWEMIPHELTHLVNHICSTLSLDEEANAYLTGFIYKTLYQLGLFESISTDYIQNSINDKSISVRELMKQFRICMGELNPDMDKEVDSKTAEKVIKMNNDLDELINSKFDKFDENKVPLDNLIK